MYICHDHFTVQKIMTVYVQEVESYRLATTASNHIRKAIEEQSTVSLNWMN